MRRPILLTLALAICWLSHVSARGKVPKLALTPDHIKGETLVWPDWSNQTVSCCTYKRWASVILLKQRPDNCWELLGQEQNLDCHACVTYNVPMVTDKDKGRYWCLLVPKDDFFDVDVEPKTTTESTPPIETDLQCQGVDLAFALDSSGTVSEPDFLMAKDFVKNIVSSLGMDVSVTNQYGLITFATDVTPQFYLGNFTSVMAVNNAVDGIPGATSGQTHTNKALKFLRNKMFNLINGARKDPGVPEIAIIITDGMSTQPDLTKEQAQELLDAGVRVFVIGVGMRDASDTSELEMIAGDPGRVFEVDEFSDLAGILDDFIEAVCNM